MTRERKRRKPGQIAKLLLKGYPLLMAAKTETEVFQRLGITESIWR